MAESAERMMVDACLQVQVMIVKAAIKHTIRNLKQLNSINTALKLLFNEAESLQIHRPPHILTNPEANTLRLLLASDKINTPLIKQAHQHIVRDLFLLQLVQVHQEGFDHSLQGLSVYVLEQDVPVEARVNPF